MFLETLQSRGLRSTCDAIKEYGDAPNGAAYAGRYRNEEVMATYQVIANGANLDFRIADKPDYVFHLAPLGPDTFGGDDIVVHFKRNAKGGVTGASVATDRLFDLQFQKL